MGRQLLVLVNDTIRSKAIAWAKNAPVGTRIEFKSPKRSLPQNDRLWAMLTDISRQATLGGQKYTPEEWKCIFMDALGQEIRFLPRLEGSGFLPISHRSSDLSVREFSDLMELMEMWGGKLGVNFTDAKWTDNQNSSDDALLHPSEEGEGSVTDSGAALPASDKAKWFNDLAISCVKAIRYGGDTVYQVGTMFSRDDLSEEESCRATNIVKRAHEASLKRIEDRAALSFIASYSDTDEKVLRDAFTGRTQ